MVRISSYIFTIFYAMCLTLGSQCGKPKGTSDSTASQYADQQTHNQKSVLKVNFLLNMLIMVLLYYIVDYVNWIILVLSVRRRCWMNWWESSSKIIQIGASFWKEKAISGMLSYPTLLLLNNFCFICSFD